MPLQTTADSQKLGLPLINLKPQDAVQITVQNTIAQHVHIMSVHVPIVNVPGQISAANVHVWTVLVQTLSALVQIVQIVVQIVLIVQTVISLKFCAAPV